MARSATSYRSRWSFPIALAARYREEGRQFHLRAIGRTVSYQIQSRSSAEIKAKL